MRAPGPVGPWSLEDIGRAFASLLERVQQRALASIAMDQRHGPRQGEALGIGKAAPDRLLTRASLPWLSRRQAPRVVVEDQRITTMVTPSVVRRQAPGVVVEDQSPVGDRVVLAREPFPGELWARPGNSKEGLGHPVLGPHQGVGSGHGPAGEEPEVLAQITGLSYRHQGAIGRGRGPVLARSNRRQVAPGPY